MAIFGYSRVSTGRQADEGDSLETQQRKVNAYAMSEGVEIKAMFVERGVSGATKFELRPQASALLSRLHRGDTVVASKLDRAFRSANDALATATGFQQSGISLVLLDIGGDVTSNGMAKLFFTIVAAFAEAERDRISERQLDAKADALARGVYRGGKVPFGYRRLDDGRLEPIEGQQLAIEFARALRAHGASLRTIRERVHAEHNLLISVEAISRLTADVTTEAGEPTT